jgi:hypothetical protein
MEIEQLIPREGMPVSGTPGPRVTKWWGHDNEAALRQNGGHPLYDESSIEYRLNTNGYRCPEFKEGADIRMISIGCSAVFGLGLPETALFHERFAERLRIETGKTVVNWNLGETAAGNDVVERVLHLAVPLLDPHIVLVLFPEIARREYLSPHGLRIKYVPTYHPPDDVTARALMDSIGKMTFQQDDELRFFRSYKSIESLLAGRCWLFGMFDGRWIETCHIYKHIARDRYIGNWRKEDRARDHAHPGPLTNDLLYGQFWQTFVTLNGLPVCGGNLHCPIRPVHVSPM